MEKQVKELGWVNGLGVFQLEGGEPFVWASDLMEASGYRPSSAWTVLDYAGVRDECIKICKSGKGRPVLTIPVRFIPALANRATSERSDRLWALHRSINALTADETSSQEIVVTVAPVNAPDPVPEPVNGTPLTEAFLIADTMVESGADAALVVKVLRALLRPKEA
jgi:hypothetical protein